MKRVAVDTYQEDKYYPRIRSAVNAILERGSVVTPIDVLIEIEVLDKDRVSRWRKGQVPYLEKVMSCNLAKASRILRILQFYAHDLNLSPSLTHYKRYGKDLRFTKTGDQRLEEAYSRHFVRPGTKSANKSLQVTPLTRRA